MYRFFSLCFVLALCSACNRNAPTPPTNDNYDLIVNKNEEGQVLEEYQVLKNTQTQAGYYRSYYEDGTLLEHSFYTAGKLDSVQRFYHPKGSLKSEAMLKDGLYHGPFKEYYEDGTTRQEVNFVENAMQGEMRNYYPNGQLKEIVQFQDNVERGPFVEYYENGNLKAEGQYAGRSDAGLELVHGALKEYNEEGTLVRRKACEMGICKTVWTAED